MGMRKEEGEQIGQVGKVSNEMTQGRVIDIVAVF